MIEMSNYNFPLRKQGRERRKRKGKRKKEEERIGKDRKG